MHKNLFSFMFQPAVYSHGQKGGEKFEAFFVGAITWSCSPPSHYYSLSNNSMS
jgi:hypothetical protein